MKIYSYGVIDSNNKIDEPIPGTDGVRIYNIPYREIGMVVSNSEERVREVGHANSLGHNIVVEHLMRRFTVLPVRVRTLLHKEDIMAMMEGHYYDFREDLDRLRNKVEFGIKILWQEDQVRDRLKNEYGKGIYGMLRAYDSKGKKFIEDVFEKYVIEREFREMADICIAIVDNFLDRFVSERRLEKLKGKDLLLKAFYLVEKRMQKDFREAFEIFRIAPGGFNYQLRGPLPPYNFVNMESREGAAL